MIFLLKKKFDPDGTLLMETIHKIHPVADYNFKTKFSDFNIANNNGSPIKEDNSKKNSNNNLIEEMNNVDNQYSPNKDLFDII